MSVSDFALDLEYSLEARENVLFDRFYHRVFPELERVEFVGNLAEQRRGIDKVLHFRGGGEVRIDEKKRRKNYGDDILLELWSVWSQQNKKRGWLYTCQSDYVVYAVMPAHKVYLLPVLLLKQAWTKHSAFWLQKYGELRPAKNKGYVTRNIAIPTNALLGAISAEMRQALTQTKG